MVIRTLIGLGTYRFGFFKQRLGFLIGRLELPGIEQALDQQAFIFKADSAPFRDQSRGGLPQGNGARQILRREVAPVRAVIVGVVDDVELVENS